ncbi:MAG: hypothetical protein WA177_07190, partial [Xanthobacteraceae bacterium]
SARLPAGRDFATPDRLRPAALLRRKLADLPPVLPRRFMPAAARQAMNTPTLPQPATAIVPWITLKSVADTTKIALPADDRRYSSTIRVPVAPLSSRLR